jgi:hypothetical protein
MSSKETWRVFLRSATNFQEFATNPKKHITSGISRSAALSICRAFNEHRGPEEIEKGTKMEFEMEDQRDSSDDDF